MFNKTIYSPAYSGFTLPCLDFLSAPHLRGTDLQIKSSVSIRMCLAVTVVIKPDG